MAVAIFQILAGVAAIVFGFTAGEFYPAFVRRPQPDEKPMPKWLGRTVSAVVGVWFILSGQGYRTYGIVSCARMSTTRNFSGFANQAPTDVLVLE